MLYTVYLVSLSSCYAPRTQKPWSVSDWSTWSYCQHTEQQTFAVSRWLCSPTHCSLEWYDGWFSSKNRRASCQFNLAHKVKKIKMFKMEIDSACHLGDRSVDRLYLSHKRPPNDWGNRFFDRLLWPCSAILRHIFPCYQSDFSYYKVWKSLMSVRMKYLPLPKRLCFCQTLFVCLFVCQQDNSKSYGRIVLKFWGYVGNGTNYQWLNFGGDPEGILDSGSLWNFRYHCFQWDIRETAAKRKMVLLPSEQHGLGGGVWALTAF